jgi:hypothetical protein
MVKRERGVVLLHYAIVHNDDAIAHRHRFNLVVRNVNHGRLEPLMELGDLGSHLHPHLGVKVGERLVEKENFRLAHNGASDRDPLPLSARKRFRFAIEQVLDPENAGRVDHAFLISVFGNFRNLRPKARLSKTLMCG